LSRTHPPVVGRLESTEVMANVRTLILIAFVSLLGACTPTVKVATDEPITINLNVNIKHEILVKVDRQLDDLFEEEGDLF
jgi:YnbE-like lipoprotein